jgi:hypothetical protein
MPARDLREHADRLLSFAAAARRNGFLYLAELYTAAAARGFERASEVEKSTSSNADSPPKPAPTDGREWSHPPWRKDLKQS